MTKVDRAGIFKAGKPISAQFEKTEKGALGISFKWPLTHYLDGSQWVDWSQYEMCAYGRLLFIKTDGTPNDVGVTMLRDVLGWNGDIDNVETYPWPACQVNVKVSEFDGKTQYRVEWVNPIDYEGKPKEMASPSDIAEAKARFGSTLRALFGQKPASTPAPNGKPAAPAKPSNGAKLPPPPPKKAPIGMTKEEAWSYLVAEAGRQQKGDRAYTETEVARAWEVTFLGMFPDKPEDQLTAQDWTKLAHSSVANLIPF